MEDALRATGQAAQSSTWTAKDAIPLTAAALSAIISSIATDTALQSKSIAEKTFSIAKTSHDQEQKDRSKKKKKKKVKRQKTKEKRNKKYQSAHDSAFSDDESKDQTSGSGTEHFSSGVSAINDGDSDDYNLTTLFDQTHEVSFCSTEEAPPFIDVDLADEASYTCTKQAGHIIRNSTSILVTATNEAGLSVYEQARRGVDAVVHGRQSSGSLVNEDDAHAEDAAMREQVANNDKYVSDYDTLKGNEVNVEDFAAECKPTTLADHIIEIEGVEAVEYTVTDESLEAPEQETEVGKSISDGKVAEVAARSPFSVTEESAAPILDDDNTEAIEMHNLSSRKGI
ncbi:hypothetical protein SLS60_010725 [Paraconiothyrium brasiliense]|uniref:Uncharacterized protein n=1 Tax=Paraconiothyrium brasiliense TaxID=300254 RepID=A0ABR3QLT4_9PLEO